MFFFTESYVCEQPPTARPDSDNDATDARTATEPGNATDDVKPTGIFIDPPLSCSVISSDKY